MTLKVDGLTDMGQAKAGACLRSKHKFGFGIWSLRYPLDMSSRVAWDSREKSITELEACICGALAMREYL